MSVLFCARADLILSLSQDAQAQLSNDPLRRWPIANADGLVTTFTTPFAEITTASVYKAGVAVTTGWALSSGTGTDGRDQIIFTVAPTSGMIAVAADKRALNLTVLDAAIAGASSVIARYLPTGTDVTDTWLLAALEPICIHLAKAELRGRRELGMSDALDMLVKADMEWLRSVRDGKTVLPVSPSGGTNTQSTVLAYAEDSVFGTFGENDSDTDDELTPE